MKIYFDAKYISIAATILVAIILYLTTGLLFDGFMTLEVFINFLTDNAFLGIIAIGMTLVILSGNGGIDLSVGSVVAFAGVLTATLVERNHFHPLAAILIVLVCGALLGLGHGFLIQKFKIPPFIATLAGMFLARGMAQIISLESIPIYHPFFQSFVSVGIPLGNELTLPAIAVIFLVVLMMGIYLAHLTTFGRTVYALGGNQTSAMLMGLPVKRTVIMVYTLNGILSALGGIVYTMYTSAGYSLAGVGLELDAIASVVIGGTLITGGVGYLAGTFVGVLILGIIQTFVTFEGTLSSWWTRIFIGTLLLLFILFQKFISQTSILTNKSKEEMNTTKIQKDYATTGRKN